MKYNILWMSLFLMSCSVDTSENEFRIFEKYKKKQNYSKSLESLNKIISKSKDKKKIKRAYLEMAELTVKDLKSPESAIKIYQKLALLSERGSERNDYRFLVSKIYLEYLNDNDSAIREAQSIDLEGSSKKTKLKVKKIVIESYKNKKNYFQAMVELDNLLKIINVEDEGYFELLRIKAELLFFEKKPHESNLIYQSLVNKYPGRANGEKLYLNILANYESIGAYDKAISLLEDEKDKYRANKKFIVSKLKRLKDLKKNMPGAKGLRR